MERTKIVLFTLMILAVFMAFGYAMYRQEMAWKALEEKTGSVVDQLDKNTETARQIARSRKERQERQRVLDQLDDHQQ